MSDVLKQHADTSLPLQSGDKHVHKQMRRKPKVLDTDWCRWYGKFKKRSMHKIVAVLFYNLLFIVSFQRCFILAFLWHIAQSKVIVMDMLLLSVGVNDNFNGQYMTSWIINGGLVWSRLSCMIHQVLRNSNLKSSEMK